MQFQTDGVDLIVDRLGTLINVTREGQREMADVMRQHLKRIERNAAGVPVRMFLFTRTDERSGQPAAVVIDPHFAFGRPVLAGRAVSSAVLADRFKAGDSFEQLAGDYGTSPAGDRGSAPLRARPPSGLSRRSSTTTNPSIRPFSARPLFVIAIERQPLAKQKPSGGYTPRGAWLRDARQTGQ